MEEAIDKINANNAPLGSTPGGVRGSPVDATVRFRRTPDAAPSTYLLSGTLRYKKPRDLIVLLRHGLAGEVLQAGSNDDEYWLWIRPEVNTLWWGQHTAPGPVVFSSRPASRPARIDDDLEHIPIRPDHLLDVLGLADLPLDTTGMRGPVYRPEAERNVLLFLDYDPIGQAYIHKEYALDAWPPHLIREVTFRSPDARVIMCAALSAYTPVAGTQSLAPGRVRIEWPPAKSSMDLRIFRYIQEEDPLLPPENPVHDETVPLDHEIRVDAPLPGPIDQPT